MTSNAPTSTTIRDENQLLEHWNGLKPGINFDDRTLWISFLAPDGTPIPTLVPIAGLPVTADPAFTANLSMVVTQAIGGTDLSAVFLLSRPGLGSISKTDRSWAAALRESIEAVHNPWPVCLLTQDRAASVIRQA